jgi:hypothetical protein
MPEWLSHAITSVLTAVISSGIVVKILAWRYRTQLASQANERGTRKDEVDVLHTSIDQLRKDVETKELERIADRKYWEARDARREKELRELKDQYTACQVRTEGLEREREYTAERAHQLEDRVKVLEAEAARMRESEK